MYLSPETVLFIREHRNDDIRSLALQAKKYPQVDMSSAIVQIAGWQAAASKIPSWHATENLLYPRHLSLEQCSSEITALYKASLAQGETLVDLTGGFGIDCAFLAARFKTVTYIERQKELCEIAAHNFPLLGLKQIRIQNADGVEYLQTMSPTDCIFLDPARRNEHGGKTVAISDCEPNAAALEELLLEKGQQVIIKLSPMLDLSLAIQDMKHVSEVHIISVNNECKELLLMLRSEKTSPTILPTLSQPIVCINFANRKIQRFVFTRETEQSTDCSYTHKIGTYLYEPNASILKAGAFRSIASAFHLSKLHPNSHLYTSDERIEEFPGRIFRVTGYSGLNKKELKNLLNEVDKANLTVRNFPQSVAELRKRLKIADGGDIYLFATTLNDERKIIIRCEKA